MHINNNRGVAHPFIALIFAVLVMIGAWYVYMSYEDNSLKQNLTTVFSDYKTLTLSVVKDANDRARVEALYQEIEGIVSKYDPAAAAVTGYRDIRK